MGTTRLEALPDLEVAGVPELAAEVPRAPPDVARHVLGPGAGAVRGVHLAALTPDEALVVRHPGETHQAGDRPHHYVDKPITQRTVCMVDPSGLGTY